MAEDVVRAKRFEVVDEEGQVRIALDAMVGDAAVMGIYDREGRTRAAFGIFPGGGAAAVALKDSEGRDRASLAVGGPEGNMPRLQLLDGDGKVRAHIIVHDEGEVAVIMHDIWGQKRIQLGVSEDAGLILRDREGKAVEGITTRSS